MIFRSPNPTFVESLSKIGDLSGFFMDTLLIIHAKAWFQYYFFPTAVILSAVASPIA